MRSQDNQSRRALGLRILRVILLASVGAVPFWLSSALGAALDGIHGPIPLTAEAVAPPFPKERTGDQPRPRSFPEQPPTTPHSIYDDYKFGLSDNRCLLCHSSSAPASMTESTHAPMVSPSHLTVRDGRIAPEVTPGHRLCASCHVIQTDASPPIGNTFAPAPNFPTTGSGGRQQ